MGAINNKFIGARAPIATDTWNSRREHADPLDDPEYLRRESKRICEMTEALSDPDIKKELAAHSFYLAQPAEAISAMQEDLAFIRYRGVLRSSVDLLSQSEHAPDAHALRELAAWYRNFAERAGNPVIWEARLLTAEELEAEAERVERRNRRLDPDHGKMPIPE